MTPRGQLRMGLAAALAALAAAGLGAEPITLTADAPVHLVCETKSIGFAKDAASASRGTLGLKLVLLSAGPTSKGRWMPASVDDRHTGSLAFSQRDTCANGCPLAIAANGELQLWSPAPRSLEGLKDDESLLIAVVRADGATLRASTFRGKQIEALEEGTCRRQP